MISQADTSTDTVIDEVERVPIHLTKVLSMLERWEARVSNELDLVPEGSAPDSKLAKQLGEIAKNSKPIAQELRAWVDKVDKVVKNLSLEDKLKVSLGLIQQLSKGDRLRFYHTLMATEKKRSDDGILLAVTNYG